jgi:hypothetical protein
MSPHPEDNPSDREPREPSDAGAARSVADRSVPDRRIPDQPAARNVDAPRARRWIKIIGAQIVLVLAGLALLEGLARGYLRWRGEPYDAAQLAREVDHLVKLGRLFVPAAPEPAGRNPEAAPVDAHMELTIHPYLGFEVDVGCSYVDDEYQRLRSGASKDEFEIVIVGGSVAALFGGYDARTHAFRDAVSADPRFAGHTVRVLNFGRGAYKEPQQVNFVAYLFALGFKPDVVIDIDGFNEAALACENRRQGSNPIFPSVAQWAHLCSSGSSNREAVDRLRKLRASQRSLEAWAAALARWHLDRFAILGKPVLHHMYSLRRRIAAETHDYTQYVAEHDESARTRGPNFEGGPPTAVLASVECWKQCSRSLADMCRARGVVYVQFLQPTGLDAGSKPLTAHEKECTPSGPGWTNGVAIGYPRFRAAAKEFHDLGVDFVDASMLFEHATDEIYYDPCHYGDRGNELLAARVAAELLKRLPEKL